MGKKVNERENYGLVSISSSRYFRHSNNIILLI
nr:MAG TPA: hypothetical protein [Caudoviricetes sp.]